MTVTVCSTFIRRCHGGKQHVEIRVGNVETSDGAQQVFGAVAKTETDVAALIWRKLGTVGQAADTDVTAFTHGCPGLRSIPIEAGCKKPPIANWFHIALRLQHAEQAASGLSTDTRGRTRRGQRPSLRSTHLHRRIWNGKAKNARMALNRIRKAMHLFQGERSQRTMGVPSFHKAWDALRGVDNCLRGQSARLVNYAGTFWYPLLLDRESRPTG